MRIFIAIKLTDQIVDDLCITMQKLEENSKKGNFTHIENLHVTLVFLGEAPEQKLEDIKQAMDTIECQRFDLSVKGLGKFKREGGDIYWVGIEKNEVLSSIYNQLYMRLSEAGFRLENREFKPHLTIGREVILQPDFSLSDFQKNFPEMKMTVPKISLMLSERINGKLTYTELYSRELTQ